MDDLPLAVRGSDLQQGRRAQFNAPRFIGWRDREATEMNATAVQSAEPGRSVKYADWRRVTYPRVRPSPSWRSFSSSAPSGFSGFTNAALQQGQTQKNQLMDSLEKIFTLYFVARCR